MAQKSIVVKRGFHQFQSSRPRKGHWKQIVILIIVLFLVLGFVPIRSSKMEESLKERFNDWFSDSATFSSCKMKLFRGIYLTDFVIYRDSSMQEVVFQAPLVMLKINPFFYLFTGSTGIYVQQPEMALEVEPGSIQWPPSLKGLFEDREWVPADVPSYLRVDHGRLTFSRDGEEVLGTDGLDLAVSRLRRTGKKPFECRGTVQREERSVALHMEGDIDPSKSRLEIAGSILPATEGNLVFDWPRTDLTMEGLDWSLEVTREGSVYKFLVDADPQNGSLAFSDGDLTLGVNESSATIRYSEEDKKINLDEVVFRWEDYSSLIEGEFSLADYKPFRISVSSDDLPAQVVSNMLDLRFSDRPVDFVDGRLAFQVKASGLISNASSTVYRGDIGLHGCTFEHTATGFRIKDVSGDIGFDPERISFERLEARYDDGSLLIGGSLQGSPYVWQDPQLTLKTEGALDLSETGRFIEGLAPNILEGVEPDGTAKLSLDIQGPAKEPERMEISGTVYLSDVSLSKGPLPVPFHGIQGNILVDQKEMKIESVQGSTGRSNVQVSGLWTRGEESWTDGTIEFEIQGDAEASEVFPAVSKAVAGFGGYTVEGPFGFDLSISGLVSEPTDIAWHGDIVLKDAVVRDGIFDDSLTDVTGEVSFKPDKTTTATLQWKRRNIPGRLSYDRKGDDNTLAVKADFLLNEIRNLSERYLDLDLRGLRASGNVFIDMAAAWEEDKMKEAELKGRVDFEGGNLNHENWPLPLESIEGIVNVADSVFLTDRLSVSSGNAQATVKGQYKEGALIIESLSSVELAQVLDKARKVYKGRYDEWNAGGSADFLLKSGPATVEGSTETVRQTQGRITFHDAYVQNGSMSVPVEDLNGELEFSPDRLKSEEMAFSLGETRGTATFDMSGMNDPSVTGSIDADFIDFNGLLGFFGARSRIESRTTAAPVRLVSGQVRAASFEIYKMSGSGLDMDLAFADKGDSLGLELSKIHFKTAGGSVSGNYDALLKSDGFIYSGSVETKQVALGDFIDDVELEHEGTITGHYDLAAGFQGSDLNLANLVAKGEFLGQDLRLAGNRLFSELGQEAQLNVFEDIPFDQVYAPFLILETRVYTPDMRWIGDVAEMLWQGSFGMDRSLNYSFNAAISASSAPGTSQLGGDETSATFKFLTAKTLQMGLQGTLVEPEFTSKPLRNLVEPSQNIDEVRIEPMTPVR